MPRAGSFVTRQPLRLVLGEAERVLTVAAVPTPRVDAELLAAHVLGVERTRLPLVPQLDPAAVETYRRLVAQRAQRVPLQHLTGAAVLGGVTVAVGPGVFVPRPETELLLAWGLAELQSVRHPVVVDLCTGSGALALALAAARPDAEVHAVELDPTALTWARRNADVRAAVGDTPVRLHVGDVTSPTVLTELEDTADLVLCNPPYVPDGAPLPPEVAQHEPPKAVLGGLEGLDVLRPAIGTAVRLLRPGGALAIEHDDGHGEVVPGLLSRRRVLTDIAEHTDLAGRPRFATAHRRP